MTVLEALAILEAATRECKQRNVNTPEIREALDSLDRYVWPKWLVPQFRLVASDGYGQSDVIGKINSRCFAPLSLESVTQCGSFSVCEWMHWRVDSMRHDTAVKDEIYRLARDMGRSRSRGFLTRKASTWSLSDTIVISPARFVALHPQPLLASPE